MSDPRRVARQPGSARSHAAVVLREHENGVCAYIVAVDASDPPGKRWGRAAASEFLERHAAPLELVIGRRLMHLVSGRELLDAIRAAGRPVAVFLLSGEHRSRGSRRSPFPLPRPRRVVPFDARIVAEYLQRIGRLTDAA